MNVHDWAIISFVVVGAICFCNIYWYAGSRPPTCERHNWKLDERLGKLRCAVCNKVEGL